MNDQPNPADQEAGERDLKAAIRDAAGSSWLARLIRECCGNGQTLALDTLHAQLLPELLESGVDAYGLLRNNAKTGITPERCFSGDILALPFPDNYFETVVSIESLGALSPEKLSRALKEVRRVSSRYVFLRLPAGTGAEASPPQRAWWELRCFEAGFRKHPLYYRANPYESLNEDGAHIFVLLEKVPDEALRDFDLTVLEEERLLHTDMLRETGRRSDAHCIRYQKAAEYVRPGDRVLDVACGLGYGSHLLYASSPAESVIGVDLSDFGIDYANAHYGQPGKLDFLVGDAQALENIPDNSIDFITAFETIEHVPEPEAYLQQLKRVLRPSGRIMVCAPNNWADETGKDPNPHHLHVYTWDRLVSECGDHFLLEKGFLQTAGGAMRCHFSPRSWVEVPPDRPLSQDGEWIIILGMADPVAHADVPYTENFWNTPDSPDFHVSAFCRDYQNPWLLRSIVARGMRANSHHLLASLQDQVLKSADPLSVDYGAALCGRIYGLLESGEHSAEVQRLLQERSQQYCSIQNPSPHQLRWQVSLLYASAEVARSAGRYQEAVAFYEACAAKDVTAFSPLLGNKTLDAYFWLATLSISQHDSEQAKVYLQRAVNEAVRLASGPWLNIIGDPKAPLPFGFSEMAQLMDKASRAGYMLHALHEAELKPGLFQQESQGFYERQVNARDSRIRDIEESLDSLSILLSEKDAEVIRLTAEVKHQFENSLALAEEVKQQHSNAQALAEEVQRQHANAQTLALEVQQQQSNAENIAKVAEQQQTYAQGLSAEVQRQQTYIQELLSEIQRQQSQAQSLVAEVREQQSNSNALAEEVKLQYSNGQELAAEIQRQHSNGLELAAEVQRQSSNSQALAAEVQRQHSISQELADEVQREQSNGQELAAEVQRLHLNGLELASEVQRQHAHAQELADGMQRQYSNTLDMAEEIQRQNAHTQALAMELQRQHAHIESLAAELQQQYNRVAELTAEIQSLGEAQETAVALGLECQEFRKLPQSKTDLLMHLLRRVVKRNKT